MNVRAGSSLSLFSAALACAGLLAVAPIVRGQDAGTEKTTKTKITIEEGKDVKVVGCVTRADSGALMLTSVADKKGPLSDYVLVTDTDKEQDLLKHVGHQVEISGKAANQGEGKVKFEVEEKTKPKGGDERKTESSSEMVGTSLKLPLLGVKSFKMIAGACS